MVIDVPDSNTRRLNTSTRTVVVPAVQHFITSIDRLNGEDWQKKLSAFDVLLDSIRTEQAQAQAQAHKVRSKTNIQNTNYAGLRPTLAEKRLQSKAFQINYQPLNNIIPWYENPTEIKRLAVPLRLLLRDLRSQLVKEVCQSVVRLSYLLSEKNMRLLLQIGLAEDFLSINGQSVRVMQVYATDTMMALLLSVKSKKLLELFIEQGIVSRSKDVRCACVRYVKQIVQNWPHAYILGKHNNNESRSTLLLDCQPWINFKNFLEKSLLDMSPNVRDEARRLFVCFHGDSKYTTYAEQFLTSSHDLRLKKYLQEALDVADDNSTLSVVEDASIVSNTSQITEDNSVRRHRLQRSSYIPSPTVSLSFSTSLQKYPPTPTIENIHKKAEDTVHLPFSFLSPQSLENKKIGNSPDTSTITRTSPQESSQTTPVRIKDHEQFQSKELAMLQQVRKAVEVSATITNI